MAQRGRFLLAVATALAWVGCSLNPISEDPARVAGDDDDSAPGSGGLLLPDGGVGPIGGGMAVGGAMASGGYPSTGGASSGGSGGSVPGTGGSGAMGEAAGAPATDADAGPEATGGAAGAPNACAKLDPTQPASFFLSADDSNSMASPVIARRLIQSGALVPGYLVRTYEFLNYYDVGYPAAPPGTLALYPEVRQEAATGDYQLLIGVASEPAAQPRRGLNLTFALDTSGSMAGAPLALEQAALRAVATSLSAGDIVSLITWSDQFAILLDSRSVSGPDDAVLLGAIATLTAGGSTNLNAGLSLAYELAQRNYATDRLNRVVLISDGQANTGVTDAQIIGAGADLNDGDGIYLAGVGVGDGVNDTLMDAATDAGRGAYVYLDTEAEAQRMFGARFDEVMDVAARAVQVELRMPWYMGIARFYGEQYSTVAHEVEPQHLAPGDAMTFFQTVKPCGPDVYVATDPVQVFARWKTPATHVAQQNSVTTTVGDLLAAGPHYLPKAFAIVAYAEALKAGSSPALLQSALVAVDAADPGRTDPELAEIRALLGRLLGNP